MASGKDKYFQQEKSITTKIKHKIFYETFTTSLGTANNIVRKHKEDGKDKIYTYVDLYAGEGLFNFGSKEEYGEDDFGTPLYAAEAFWGFLETKGGKGYGVFFDRLKILACEKDKVRRSNLRTILTAVVKDMITEFSFPIEAHVMSEWEDPKNSVFIRENVCSAQFGFIFADPFSTELNLKHFQNLLRGCAGLHDVLIFVNFGHIRRALGRRRGTDFKRVAGFLGLTEEQLEHLLGQENTDMHTYLDLVLDIIVKRMYILKGRDNIFVTGVALPLDVRRRLVNQDYYGLVLATGAIPVVNAFLKAYVDALREFGNLPPMGRLFNTLPAILVDMIKQFNTPTLYDLVLALWSNLFSWKHIVNSGLVDEFPTAEKIVEVLNALYESRVVNFLLDEDKKGYYLYRTKKKVGIKPSSLKGVKDYKQIRILYKG